MMNNYYFTDTGFIEDNKYYNSYAFPLANNFEINLKVNVELKIKCECI